MPCARTVSVRNPPSMNIATVRAHAARFASWQSLARARGLPAARKLGPDHAERYLASFAWRYNRRYHLKTMIPSLVHGVARTKPMPYRTLIAG